MIMFRLLFIAAILIVNTISTCRADDKNDKDDILSTNLIRWLRDNGAYINDKLVVKYNGVYRGIYATEDMEVGEQLCSIPSNLMIQPDIKKESTDEEDTIYPHCNTIKEVMKAVSADDDNTNPYGEYLKAQPIGYLPTFWSDSAKELLITMLKSTQKEYQTDLVYYGLEYDELPPHGIQYKLDEIQYECNIDDQMMNNPIYKQAAMLVTARGDYEYMIPYYDMFNHNNARYNIHHDYTLDETPDNRGFTVSKPVKAGEELFNAYNRCNICNDRLDWYGTPEMWLEYGFVESIPQRWLFDFARVKFELEWKDGDESKEEMVVNFLVPMSSKGKRLLQEELTRLDNFATLHRHKSHEEYGDMTRFEWESLWQYYDALHNALTLATTQSNGSLSDEVWKLSHDWWVKDGTLKEEDSEEHYVLRTKSYSNDEL